MNLALFISLPLMVWATTYIQKKKTGLFPERLKKNLELFFLGIYPVIFSLWSDHAAFQILFIVTSISYWIRRFITKLPLEGVLFAVITGLFYLLWPETISQKTLIGILYIPFGLFFFFGEVAGRLYPSTKLAWSFNILYLLLMYVLIQMILEIGI